jgi:hypothetical protein
MQLRSVFTVRLSMQKGAHGYCVLVRLVELDKAHPRGERDHLRLERFAAATLLTTTLRYFLRRPRQFPLEMPAMPPSSSPQSRVKPSALT